MKWGDVWSGESRASDSGNLERWSQCRVSSEDDFFFVIKFSARAEETAPALLSISGVFTQLLLKARRGMSEKTRRVSLFSECLCSSHRSRAEFVLFQERWWWCWWWEQQSIKLRKRSFLFQSVISLRYVRRLRIGPYTHLLIQSGLIISLIYLYI